MNTDFTPVGEWHLDGKKIMASGNLEASKCLFAFFVEGETRYSYIGMTMYPIRDRMRRNIRNADDSSDSYTKLRDNIKKEIQNGRRVEIHQYIPQRGTNLRTVKDNFISSLKPYWNKRGK